MMDSVKSANPYVEFFWKNFPYAWQYGICDTGVGLNNAKYPLNITDIRWALALAINITELNIIAWNGLGRFATFSSLSVPYIQKHYETILLPWIKNFSLPDGYKPFDDTIPYKLANYIKSLGYTLAADPVTIWSYGWWRYDPEEATKLLEKHGFYKDQSGKWHLPNGDLWTIGFIINSGHVMASRLGYAVVEQWRKFGINVLDEAIPPGVHATRYNLGDFDATYSWPFCCGHIDVWQWWLGMHEKYYKPVGEIAVNNQIRWVNHRFSELLDELATIPPEDPRVISIVSEMVKIRLAELPHINMIMGSKMIVRDTFVWTNWPTGENWYWEESHWNPVWMLPMLVKLEPTGNVPSSEWGLPTTPTPTVPTELNATIMAIADNVVAMNQVITAMSEDLARVKTEVSSLREQLGTMSTIIVMEAAVIIILAAGLVYMRIMRKRT